MKMVVEMTHSECNFSWIATNEKVKVFPIVIATKSPCYSLLSRPVAFARHLVVSYCKYHEGVMMG